MNIVRSGVTFHIDKLHVLCTYNVHITSMNFTLPTLRTDTCTCIIYMYVYLPEGMVKLGCLCGKAGTSHLCDGSAH